jgi:hypothetical protein
VFSHQPLSTLSAVPVTLAYLCRAALVYATLSFTMTLISWLAPAEKERAGRPRCTASSLRHTQLINTGSLCHRTWLVSAHSAVLHAG